MFHDRAWDVETQTPFEDGYAAAVAICRSCPCRRECVDRALQLRPVEIQGVFAGANPKLLRQLIHKGPVCRGCGEPVDPLEVVIVGRRRCQACRQRKSGSEVDERHAVA